VRTGKRVGRGAAQHGSQDNLNARRRLIDTRRPIVRSVGAHLCAMAGDERRTDERFRCILCPRPAPQLRALLAELERTDTYFVFAEPVNTEEAR